MSLLHFRQAIPSTSGFSAGGGDSLQGARRATPFDSSQHPFYRLPAGHPKTPLKPFDGVYAMTAMPPARGLACKLARVQQMFSKPRLCRNDFPDLMSLAYDLVRYATTRLATDLSGETTYGLVAPLARRFLLLDSLWVICEVVGAPMNKGQWWDKLMETMPNPQDISPPPRFPRRGWYYFVEQLIAALEIYRTGGRPAPEMVVEIKRKIVSKEVGHPLFQSHLWDLWRQLDKEFSGSS